MNGTTSELRQISRSSGFGAMAFAPPIAAFAYPFLLKGFTATVSSASGGFSLLAALILILAVSVAGIGLFVVTKLGEIQAPSVAELTTKRVALFSVAAAPLYTASGVVLYMFGDPISDITFWMVLWGSVLAIQVMGMLNTRSMPPATNATVSPRQRMVHGYSALAIVVLFLAMHLSNHLVGFLSEADHRAVMDVFRNVYRAKLVEPLIVLLFLFQVGSGAAMLWKYSKQPGDFFRSVQIVSGAYLIFFILGHMNSVFIYARTFAGIATDWNFAVGAPTGLIKDPWNIRLVPHYFLGVLFVLSHLVLGARIVALAHEVKRSAADFWTKAGFLVSAIVATLILVGMGGIHIGV